MKCEVSITLKADSHEKGNQSPSETGPFHGVVNGNFGGCFQLSVESFTFLPLHPLVYRVNKPTFFITGLGLLCLVSSQLLYYLCCYAPHSSVDTPDQTREAKPRDYSQTVGQLIFTPLLTATTQNNKAFYSEAL